MSSDGINGIAWWMGWRPKIVIIGSAIIMLVIGIAVDQTGLLVIIGFIGGVAGWGWGVSEVNNKYVNLRDEFFGRSRSRAEDKLGFDPDELNDSYNFRVSRSGSPPFVEAPELYSADHMFLSDVSVSVDRGSAYEVKKRDETNTGTTTEIYYDNIETISSNDRGRYTNLLIQTSQGDDIEVSSGDQTVVESAQRELRSKMRDVRRQQQEPIDRR